MGQGDVSPLVLAQKALERRLDEALKLRQNKRLLEEQEIALQEQIADAEQLVSSLGGRPRTKTRAASPPPGFGLGEHTACRVWPPARVDGRSWGSGSTPEDGTTWKGGAFAPCVLWLGYPAKASVHPEAVLRRECEGAVQGAGAVLSLLTKPSKGGVPCQYVELSTRAAAAAAMEHLQRILPASIRVQYSRKSMASMRDVPTVETGAALRLEAGSLLEGNGCAETFRYPQTQDASAGPSSRSCLQDNAVDDNLSRKKRKRRERVFEGGRRKEGPSVKHAGVGAEIGEQEQKEQRERLQEVRGEESGAGQAEGAVGVEGPAGEKKKRRVKVTGSQAEVELAAVQEREKRERRERRHAEKGRAGQASEAEAIQRQEEEERAAGAEATQEKSVGRHESRGDDHKVQRGREGSRSNREAPAAEPGPPTGYQWVVTAPLTKRTASKSTAPAPVDLTCQVAKRAEVPIPGRACVKYAAPLTNSKMRDIKWSLKDDRTFLVNQHNGKMVTWTVDVNGFGVEEGSAVSVLNSVGKWVEDFVSFDAQRVAVVYSPPAKGAAGDQLGLVDLETGRISFASDFPHVRGPFSVTTLPGTATTARLVSGGLSHEVVAWTVRDKTGGPVFRPSPLHSMHTSTVSDLAVLRHERTLLSAGLDGRVIAYDLDAQVPREIVGKRSKLPVYRAMQNPVDPNLLLLQTGSTGLQFELRDLRAPEMALSSFGWTPEVKHTQGPSTAGSWSPGGVLVASGSTDPKIHLFDIRKKSDSPLTSLGVEQKVKKSLWYRGGSVLISSSAFRNSICLTRLNL